MSRSCPLVPGSLIPFYPLIQTMSHSNREEEEEEEGEKSECRMKKRGDTARVGGIRWCGRAEMRERTKKYSVLRASRL